MQGFIETNREDPEKADVSQRLFTFEEIYEFFDNRTVAQQSDRCVQCGDPFCTTIGCPAIVDQNGYLEIDDSLCNGCKFCTEVCHFDAIEEAGDECE